MLNTFCSDLEEHPARSDHNLSSGNNAEAVGAASPGTDAAAGHGATGPTAQAHAPTQPFLAPASGVVGHGRHKGAKPTARVMSLAPLAQAVGWSAGEAGGPQALVARLAAARLSGRSVHTNSSVRISSDMRHPSRRQSLEASRAQRAPNSTSSLQLSGKCNIASLGLQ